MRLINYLLRLMVYAGISILASCKSGDYANIQENGSEPAIEPDYSGVTIPVNMAPLNFMIKEEGTIFRIKATSPKGYQVSIRSKNGKVYFPEKPWKKLLQEAQNDKIEIEVLSGYNKGTFKKFRPFHIYVSPDPVDPYVCYRLLYPGYETYLQIKIVQRDITNFREHSMVENQLLDNNCVNCHSFNRNNPDKFLLHIRGSLGGTYFVNGKKIARTDLKTKEMNSGAVYPAWHPGGRYVAFSSNNIVQSFHASPGENIEVTDLSSSLVLYDSETNSMERVLDSDTIPYMETFPEWSPDGKYLYFCRADQYREGSDIKNIKYDLVRRTFHENSKSFDRPEMVFNAKAVNQSVSFPRISPDGKYLVFTLHDHGNFSIWHKEADLYLIELLSGKVTKMNINSDETESYHSWSSNGKWLVFSSKRGDGLTARPYFAYFESPDRTGKPFVLPQKDPDLYHRMVKTFNKPELVTGKIKAGPRDFARSAEKPALKAVWAEKKYK